MQFLSTYIPKEPAGPPLHDEQMKTMGALIDRITRADVLLATGGLLPMSRGARVRVDGGEFTVIDGPYAESKEMVAGFALIEAASKDEAIRWAKEFMAVAGDGESDIRPLMEVDDCCGHSSQLAQEASTCGS